MLNKVQELFRNNFFGWLIHDWRVKPPFNYPVIHNSIHDILKPEDSRTCYHWSSGRLGNGHRSVRIYREIH